jgi:Cu(I)/Ag(I) efflux system membrane fusion protein
LAVVVALVVGLVGGLMIGGNEAPKKDDGAATAAAQATIWTCSMHPQIKQPNHGKCPICAMDLIPLAEGGDDTGPRELVMSASARKLAEIQTTPVKRQAVDRTVELVGTIAYDETRVKTITAWVGGRLDRLYVDYTGIEVREGDHMVDLYSPELLAGQEELRQAKKALQKIKPGPVRDAAAQTYQAVRDRLMLWGLNEKQIVGVEEGGTTERVTINAPVGGIVIHKNAVEGMYVKTGTPIYRIADLSQLWVAIEAYESDLPWLRYGQQVDFEVESYPGETFSGRISFIDPVVTAKTRTVRVRVNVGNADRRLKPGMFARAKVKAPIARGGKVLDPSLEGKWISPMHPEIVKDGPGACDVCGMDLVPAESLGFIIANDVEKPLVIPVSAALVTGDRAVVYVQQKDDPSHFHGRTVTLGPRAGDLYLVQDGLKEGDLVVTNGAFKIDSALQIIAKPSMMSPGDGDNHHRDHGGGKMMISFAGRVGLAQVLAHYLALQEALAGDNLDGAPSHAEALAKAVGEVPMGAFEGDAHLLWMKQQAKIRKAAQSLADTADTNAKRTGFDEISQAILALTGAFGNVAEENLTTLHCSMAFEGAGASWLQRAGSTANPYFGNEMLRCGDVKADLPAFVVPGAQAKVPSTGLQKIIAAYLVTQGALAADKPLKAGEAAADLLGALKAFPMGELGADAHDEWMPLHAKLEKAATRLAAATEVEEQRNQFDRLSASMIKIVRHFGAGGTDLKLAHCPMAFDDVGADWLQEGEQLANPYFGARMLRCGKVKESFK